MTSPYSLPDDPFAAKFGPLDIGAWLPASTDPEWVSATVHTDRGVLVGDVRFDTDRPALASEELIQVRVPVDVGRYRYHWVPLYELQEIIEREPRP